MLSAMVLGVIGLYLVLWIIVVTVTYRSAKRRGAPPKQTWRAAGLAFLIMYLIPFWDWLPTVVAREYYCVTQAGFTVHKTLDQWKQENPGVAETLTWKRAPDKTDLITDATTGMRTYLLNQRFQMEVREYKLPLLAVTVVEDRLADRKTHEVLARHGDVRTGYLNPMVGGGVQGWKGWLNMGPCDGIARPSERAFDDMRIAATKLGGQQ